MSDSESVSAVEMLAAMVSGTGSSRMNGLARAISYRIPVATLARVDALAGKTSRSRNAVLNLLVDVALEELYMRLPEKDMQEVLSREKYEIQHLLDADSKNEILAE